MQSVFNTVLNMSITGAYIAAAIILLRLALKKLPKRYSYALWAILGIRLLCPFSFSSIVSLFNVFKPETAAGSTMTYIPEEIKLRETPQISVGIPPVNTAINDAINAAIAENPVLQPNIAESVSPTQIVYFVCTYIWAAGVIAMLIYTVVSYLLVYKRVKGGKPLYENIFVCDRIDTPFVFGIIKPRIYLPEGLAEGDTAHILKHERTHIRRGDHIVKLIAMLALCLHWFNPLVWVSYILMTKDMELSCDERAVAGLGADERKEYAGALLNISARQNKISLGGILAFGESNIKSRIKGVLGYKKPALWVMIAGITTVAAAAVVLITNASAENNTAGQDNSGIWDPDLPPFLTATDAEKFGLIAGENKPITPVTVSADDRLVPENWLPVFTRAEALERLSETVSADTAGMTAADAVLTLVNKNVLAFELFYASTGDILTIDRNSPYTAEGFENALYPVSSPYFSDTEDVRGFVSGTYNGILADKFFYKEPFVQINGRMYINNTVFPAWASDPFFARSYIEITDVADNTCRFIWHWADTEKLNAPENGYSYFYYEKPYCASYLGGKWRLDDVIFDNYPNFYDGVPEYASERDKAAFELLGECYAEGSGAGCPFHIIGSREELNNYAGLRRYFFGEWKSARDTFTIDDSEYSRLSKQLGEMFIGFYRVSENVLLYKTGNSAETELYWLDTNEPDVM